MKLARLETRHSEVTAAIGVDLAMAQQADQVASEQEAAKIAYEEALHPIHARLDEIIEAAGVADVSRIIGFADREDLGRIRYRPSFFNQEFVIRQQRKRIIPRNTLAIETTSNLISLGSIDEENVAGLTHLFAVISRTETGAIPQRYVALHIDFTRRRPHQRTAYAINYLTGTAERAGLVGLDVQTVPYLEQDGTTLPEEIDFESLDQTLAMLERQVGLVSQAT